MRKPTNITHAVRCFFLLNGALLGSWVSRIPYFEHEFELSAARLGQLFLSMAIGAMVAFPIAGRLSDQFGASKVTRRAALFAGPALLAVGASPNVGVLFVTLFFFGAVSGALAIGMNGWGTAVAKRTPKRIMSGIHAMFSVGAALGAGAGALSAAIGLLPVLQYLFTLAILVPLALWLARAPWTDRIAQDLSGHRGLVIPKGGLALTALICAGSAIGEGGMADWGALLAMEMTGASPGPAALGYSFFAIAMVAGRFSGDVVVARIGEVATGRLSGVLIFAGVMIVISTGMLNLAYLGFALMGLGYSNLVPLSLAKAADGDHDRPGAAIASVSSFGHGGMLLGPVVISTIAEAFSLSTAFLMLGLIGLAIIALSGALKTTLAGSREHASADAP